ncbi:hypothetical protein QBC36DRAFT_301807 [Triangularia setosa]|uniref:Uncharacterized protein n=1 Tax=Triangularia setosa TaxID=2587417 RepID=A0AAN7A702_9PEZI|nr:hypothetical protein QBC36DRAFT_301807 [Podospora setosa]
MSESSARSRTNLHTVPSPEGYPRPKLPIQDTGTSDPRCRHPSSHGRLESTKSCNRPDQQDDIENQKGTSTLIGTPPPLCILEGQKPLPKSTSGRVIGPAHIRYIHLNMHAAGRATTTADTHGYTPRDDFYNEAEKWISHSGTTTSIATASRRGRLCGERDEWRRRREESRIPCWSLESQRKSHFVIDGLLVVVFDDLWTL